MAAVIFEQAVQGLEAGAWYPIERRELRMRDGSSASVRAEHHPDPLVEALRWQVCEAELLQAEARVRSNRRRGEAPVWIDIVTSVCLPLTIDSAVEWSDLTAESNAVALMSARGLVTDKPADAAKVLPELFKTAAAARRYFQGAGAHSLIRVATGNCARMPYGDPIRRLGIVSALWTRVRYRTGNRGPRSAALLPPATLDPRAALERVVGPVRGFEVLDPPRTPMLGVATHWAPPAIEPHNRRAPAWAKDFPPLARAWAFRPGFYGMHEGDMPQCDTAEKKARPPRPPRRSPRRSPCAPADELRAAGTH